MILVRYFSTTLAENLISLSGIPSDSIALLTLSDLPILFISSLEAGGKSKLKVSGKTFFFYGCNTGKIFVRFTYFFTVALS